MKKYLGILLAITFLIANLATLMGQEDTSNDDFSEFDALFDEAIDTVDENDENSSTSSSDFSDNFDGINIDAFSQTDDFQIYGEQKVVFPIPVNPDYFDYTSAGRAPQQHNLLGFQYGINLVTIYTELYVDFYASQWSDSNLNVNNILNWGMGDTYLSVGNQYIAFSAGYRKFSWGSSMTMSPIDHINPRNISKGGAFGEKMSIPSLALAVYPVQFMSLDLIYLPLYFSHVSMDVSPKQQIDTLKNQIQAAAPQAQVRTSVHDSYLDITQGQVGTSMNFFFPFMDMSLSYLYDVDDAYTATITSSPTAANPTAPLEYYFERLRIHRLGLDIFASYSDATGSGDVWVDFSSDLPHQLDEIDEPHIRNPEMSLVLGSKSSMGKNDLFTIANQAIFDYIVDYDPNYDLNNSDDVIEQLNYNLANKPYGATIGYWNYIGLNLLQERLKPSFAFLISFPFVYENEFNVKRSSFFLRPAIEIIPLDAFTINVGAELSWSVQRNKSDPVEEYTQDSFGILSRNNRVFIEFSYKWAKRF